MSVGLPKGDPMEAELGDQAALQPVGDRWLEQREQLIKRPVWRHGEPHRGPAGSSERRQSRYDKAYS